MDYPEDPEYYNCEFEDPEEKEYYLEELENSHNYNPWPLTIDPIPANEEDLIRLMRDPPDALISFSPWPYRETPKFDFARLLLDHMYTKYMSIKNSIVAYKQVGINIPTYHRENFYATSNYLIKMQEIKKSKDKHDTVKLSMMKFLKGNYKREQDLITRFVLQYSKG